VYVVIINFVVVMGDGMAVALWAGVDVCDLEFV